MLNQRVKHRVRPVPKKSDDIVNSILDPPERKFYENQEGVEPALPRPRPVFLYFDSPENEVEINDCRTLVIGVKLRANQHFELTLINGVINKLIIINKF